MADSVFPSDARLAAESLALGHELDARLAEGSRFLQVDPARAYGLFQQADAVADKLLALNPADPGGQARDAKLMIAIPLARTAMLLGRLEEGRRLLADALAWLGQGQHPLRPMLEDNLSAALRESGAFAQAVDLADRAASGFERWEDWAGAVRALANASHACYGLGDRDRALGFLQRARSLAGARGLVDCQASLADQWNSYVAGKRLAESPSAVDTGPQTARDPRARFKQLTLQAEAALQPGGSLARARAICREATALLANLEGLTLAQAHTDLAWLAEKLGGAEDRQIAISHAKAAVELARSLSLPDLAANAASALFSARCALGVPDQDTIAEREIDEFLGSWPEAQMQTIAGSLLLQRAIARARGGRLEAALADLRLARKQVLSALDRHSSFTGEVALLQRMNRLKEALAVIARALRVVNQEAIPEGDRRRNAWSDLLNHVEILQDNAASLCVALARPRAALKWVDNSRARLLRQQLRLRGLALQGMDLEEPGYDQIRGRLAQENAAMLAFRLGPVRSFILAQRPDEAEPRCHPLELAPAQIEADFERHLLEKPGGSRESLWSDDPRFIVDYFSSRLFSGFDVESLVRDCPVVYVMPDSHLYRVPFAALEVGAGKTLLDCCALAWTPSTAVLRDGSQSLGRRARSCLAAGCGGIPVQGPPYQVDFASMSKVVAELGWSTAAFLEEASFTLADFLRRAPDFDVIHLSLHGSLDESAAEPLSASVLHFPGHQKLTAGDLLRAGTRLRAELVFLNACVSGRFTASAVNEVGGFWQAFLLAGALSLIATLVSVDPLAAQQIAVDFYAGWLEGGLSKAEALRRAQLKLRDSGNQDHLERWASHILIGCAR